MLIDRVTAKARELGLTSCVLTFEPHPREFFAREAAPARLTRLRDKLELMEAAGLKRVHIARFDARFAARSAASFIEEVLVRGLGMRWLLVGSDFRFGERRSGDFATLMGWADAQRRLRIREAPVSVSTSIAHRWVPCGKENV